MQYLCDNNVPFCPGLQWALAQGSQHRLPLRWGISVLHCYLTWARFARARAKTAFLPAVPGCGGYRAGSTPVQLSRPRFNNHLEV